MAIILEVKRSKNLELETAELKKCMNLKAVYPSELLKKLPEGWTMGVLGNFLDKKKKWHSISPQMLNELIQAMGVSAHITDEKVKLVGV